MTRKPARSRKRSTKTAVKDPFAEREARKYERPIPSREAILDWCEHMDRPLLFEELADGLRLRSTTDIEALSRRLGAMLRDGQLVQNRRGEYCVVRRLALVAGTVIGHRDGFGFLKPDEGGDDVFLPPRQMRSLIHGDRAVVRVQGVDSRGRPEGSLVDVLERNTHELAGRFMEEHGICFLIPDNPRIPHRVLVPGHERGNAQRGQMVVVELTRQPDKETEAIGRVTRILGERHAPGMEVELAIHAHGLPHQWPADVLTDMRGFDAEVPADAKRDRLDLRDTPLVTIDGEDARDFDDAVFCEPVRGGFRLIVAIADVSHYVHPGTALDLEARNRGTSVYFPDRVIPMLPEGLSNGLCSINPDVDRLCLACEMRISHDGEVTRTRFHEGVMRSHARLTYTKVAAMLVERDNGLRKQYSAVVPHLENLHALYRVLSKTRARRGAIEFDSTETRIVFGDDRRILRIDPLVRNDAHRLIEECMIAANVEAAKFLHKHNMPTLFRVHAGPNVDRLTELRAFLHTVGLSLGGGDAPEAIHYAKLLAKVMARPDKSLIEMVLLRSLAQAVYSPHNVGHFGLALPYYAHFTSPIRRYPDLLVHRAIRHVLRGGTHKSFIYSPMQMDSLGNHCSMTERRADEATRDAVAWLKADYMKDHIGKEFDGIITGVTPFGVFVQLNGLFIEGLVHVTSLPNDYYTHDPAGHRMIGERSGRVYRLTDPVSVRVASVNLDERKIDFELVNHSHVSRPGKAARKTARTRHRPKRRR
ncbi:MAG TPA: ribonuclease R [Gammaproteobacteria bacterium]|nr:ribonuclease R [Gammaproteobacteria bacterium]